MISRNLSLLFGLSVVVVLAGGSAVAHDAALCFGTADRVTDGETVTEAEKRAGHEACQRALSDTASIVQKYHLQEADFDIIGRPPKPED